MYGNERAILPAIDGEARLAWWGFVAPTAFAILATSHVAQLEPHGPLLIAALLVFLMTQVGEIVSDDRTARPARYLVRVVLWVLTGPFLVAVLSSDGLHAARRGLALMFLAFQAMAHVLHVRRYGPATLRDAGLAFAIDAAIVWTYTARVLPGLDS